MMKYIKYIGIVLIVGALIGITVLYKNNQKLKEELGISISNQKAYDLENSNLKNQAREFKFTIDQLNNSKDSIVLKMNEVKRQLNIKDKNIKNLQYILSEATKVDTVRFTDTIFKKEVVKVDTTLVDDWYKLNLELNYPNEIVINPKFISEKYILISSKKETINPPKKCWLLRLFQKKHTVVEVEVVEKNPYIEGKQQKFIEIIK